MEKYIVAKFFTDGTYTTEFFSSLDRAQAYAKEMRNLKNGIIEKVIVYQPTEY